MQEDMKWRVVTPKQVAGLKECGVTQIIENVAVALIPASWNWKDLQDLQDVEVEVEPKPAPPPNVPAKSRGYMIVKRPENMKIGSGYWIGLPPTPPNFVGIPVDVETGELIRAGKRPE